MTIDSIIKVDFGNNIKSSYDFVGRYQIQEIPKDKYTIDFICDHELIVQIGKLGPEEEELMGEPMYYLNCLVCSTTMLRNESFYGGYKYSGVELSEGPMYHKKGFKNEYGGK